MTLVAKVDGVALPDGALLIGGSPNSTIPAGIVGLPTAAYFGEAMFGGLSIDDPDGDYDFDGLHTLTVDETADTDRPRIWNGLLAGRRVHRGPYKSGPSRVWDVDIWEMNLLFALMVFRASSAKRPYETDLVRAQYIIESAPMAFTPTVDNGRANFTDNPINFDESDLVTKYPIEALNEFVSIAGKNFYNYWDQDAEENSFHYDVIGVGPAASVTITNDEADTLDSTTFRPFLDAELDEGAEWTVTGMLLGYRGAYAYGIRQATIDALSPTIFSPSEFQRDEVYRTDRVGRLATANALIQTMLDDRAVDRATVKCSIRVPAAVVNEGIEAGDLVTVKFTHLPGYEAETDIPIIRRNVVPTEGRVDMYDVHLELSGVAKPSGPGGGDPGPFPQQPCTIGDATLVHSQFGYSTHVGITDDATFTITASPQPGNLMWVAFYLGTNAPPTMTSANLPGWTFANQASEIGVGGGPAAVYVFYKMAGPGEDLTPICDQAWAGVTPMYAYQEWSSLGDPDVIQTTSVGTGFTGNCTTVTTPTSGADVVILSAAAGNQGTAYPAVGTGIIGGTIIDEDLLAVDAVANAFYQVVTNATGSYEIGTYRSTGTAHAGVSIAFLPCDEDANQCPGAGVWKRNEAVGDGDGTTTNFFTDCPYAVGSLVVKVDGMPVITGLTEVDNTTGEFSLDFAPKAMIGDTRAEIITADYQGL